MSAQLELQFQHRRRASTNRQRPKVRDEDRKRIAVACDHCKTRKIRCTGEQPCRQCHLANITCHYPPTSAKIVVPEVYVDKLQSRIFALEKALYEAVPDQTTREEIAGRFGVKFQGQAGTSSGDPSSPSTGSWPEGGIFFPGSPAMTGEDYEADDEPGRLLNDSEGYSRFIGDSAGATFLDKIRDFMRSTVPLIPRHVSYMAAQNFPNDPTFSFTSVTSSYYTHDSLPLSLPVTDPYTLPPKAPVLKLLEAFLKFCACGTASHAVAGGGIFHWFNPRQLYLEIESLYDATTYNPSLPGDVSSVDYTSLCTVNMVLALSCQVMATSSASSPIEDELAGFPPWRPFVPGPGPVSPHMDQAYAHTREQPSAYSTGNANTLPGMTFFARAKLLFVNPVEEASLPSLRITTLMSFYLLSANRRDAAYMYIGLAVRMAVAHGLHRTWRKGEWVSGGIGRYNGAGLQDSSVPNSEDQLRKRIEHEERKREFWNIYVLDRFDPYRKEVPSCLMGRPVMLSDEDIDVDLPSNVGDELPSGAGLCAHVRLSKIMGDIVNNVYRVRKVVNGSGREGDGVIGIIERIHSDLRSWNENLSPELKLVGVVARGRSVLLLHFLYNELHILTTRPSLLLAAKQRTAAFCLSSGNIPKLPAHIEEHISICAHAARRNVALGRQLQSSGWISHHCFTDYHYVFSAAIVLLLNRLVGQETGDSFVPGTTSMPSKDEDDINFVIALLSSFGERGNEAATESAKITTELSTIVQRMVFARNQSSSASSSVGYPNHSPPSGVVGGQYGIVGYPGSQFPHPYGVPGSPGNSLTGSPTPLSPGSSGVEEVCAWLQSGHFDR